MVLGEAGNFASGNYSTVPGGTQNSAQATASIAMGQRAKAPHPNSMVINLQGNQQLVESTAPAQFLVQAKS